MASIRGSIVVTAALIFVLQGASWQPASVRALPAVAMDPDYDSLLPPQAGEPPRVQPSSSAIEVNTPSGQWGTTFEETGGPSYSVSSSMSSTRSPTSSLHTSTGANSLETSPVTTDAETDVTYGTGIIDSDDTTVTEEPTTLGGDTHGPTDVTSATTLEEATDAPGSPGAATSQEQLVGVQYKLFTRAHPLAPFLLNNVSLEGSDFDVGRLTVFVIHGFTGDAQSESVTLVRDALLWSEDVNIVVVDWAPLAAGPLYGDAVNNTRRVAAALAARVKSLAAAGLPMALVQMVGFSLGAQVAGQAGALLAASPLGRIARITGLDPARPGFHDSPDAERLDAGDADFVEVLHTASGIVSFEEPLGHVDFYPNGGRSPQPACVGESVHVVCSHLIAPRYYAESIYKPFNFRGTRCASWRDFEAGVCAGGDVAFLGPSTLISTRGVFFLRTNAKEPYGRAEVDDAAGTTTPENDTDDNRLDSRSGRKHEPQELEATAAAPPHAVIASTAFALSLVAMTACVGFATARL